MATLAGASRSPESSTAKSISARSRHGSCVCSCVWSLAPLVGSPRPIPKRGVTMIPTPTDPLSRRSQPPDGGRAFLSDSRDGPPHSPDHVAEELGEEFVRSATAAATADDDVLD